MYIIFVILIFIVWFFNLEYNSSLGNIWLRPNENGIKVFTLINVVNLLKHPLQSTFLWNLQSWDVNFYILLFFTSIYYFLFREIYKLLLFI